MHHRGVRFLIEGIAEDPNRFIQPFGGQQNAAEIEQGLKVLGGPLQDRPIDFLRRGQVAALLQRHSLLEGGIGGETNLAWRDLRHYASTVCRVCPGFDRAVLPQFCIQTASRAPSSPSAASRG